MSMKIHPELALNIDSAQIISTIAIVTLRCACVKKEILLGQMGIPIPCPSCNRVWFVSANSNIKIQEVLADFSKSLVDSLVTNKA